MIMHKFENEVECVVIKGYTFIDRKSITTVCITHVNDRPVRRYITFKQEVHTKRDNSIKRTKFFKTMYGVRDDEYRARGMTTKSFQYTLSIGDTLDYVTVVSLKEWIVYGENTVDAIDAKCIDTAYERSEVIVKDGFVIAIDAFTSSDEWRNHAA